MSAHEILTLQWIRTATHPFVRFTHSDEFKRNYVCERIPMSTNMDKKDQNTG